MCSDGYRALRAIVPAFVLPTIGSAFLRLTPLSYAPSESVLGAMLGWNIFTIVYVVLTVRTFSGVDSTEFAVRMAARDVRRPAFLRRIEPWGDGPTYAVESLLVGFLVVFIVPRLDAFEVDDWLLIPVSLSILLSCWGLSVVAYALHYAQRDLAEPGLDFPGARTHAFGDYAYFSIAVASTFGATDVNITTPAMRSVVNFHTILTFIFNSVIVALLVSLLLR